jgi:hypothetical protein
VQLDKNRYEYGDLPESADEYVTTKRLPEVGDRKFQIALNEALGELGSYRIEEGVSQ